MMNSIETQKKIFILVLLRKKKTSHPYTQHLPCYHFFILHLSLLSFFCEILKKGFFFFSPSQKAVTENREGWKKPVCKQGDIMKHADQLPLIPHMLSP